MSGTRFLSLSLSHIYKFVKGQAGYSIFPNSNTCFSLSFILLNTDHLAGLNEQARWALYAIVETGVGSNEQIGLRGLDVVDHLIDQGIKGGFL